MIITKILQGLCLWNLRKTQVFELEDKSDIPSLPLNKLCELGTVLLPLWAFISSSILGLGTLKSYPLSGEGKGTFLSASLLFLQPSPWAPGHLVVTSAVLQDIVQVPGVMSSHFGQFSLVGPFAWSRFACHCQNWFYPITKHSSFTSLSNIQVGDPTVRTSLPMALGPSLLWPTILRLTNIFKLGLKIRRSSKIKVNIFNHVNIFTYLWVKKN